MLLQVQKTGQANLLNNVNFHEYFPVTRVVASILRNAASVVILGILFEQFPSSTVAVGDENVRKVGGKAEINIAGLPNNRLPAKFSEENMASAQGAIEAILANPGQDVDFYSSIIHEQWMARNGSWAPEEQMVAYSQLSEGEKEKDRVIARDAIEVLTNFNRYHGAKFVL